MTVYGLTGSIGMGKSFVAGIFHEIGIPVFDADKTVHELTKPNGLLYADLLKTFPKAVVNGSLDRNKLAKLVFSIESELVKLENLTHPAILNQMVEFKNMNSDKDIVLEIPLLFELNWQIHCDKVIVVTAPPDIQKKRVLSRENMSEERFNKIIEIHMPEEKKLSKADFILDTSKDKVDLKQEILRIIKKD